MTYLTKANIAIMALSITAATLAIMLFMTYRELGICVQLLDPNVSAVPL